MQIFTNDPSTFGRKLRCKLKCGQTEWINLRSVEYCCDGTGKLGIGETYSSYIRVKMHDPGFNLTGSEVIFSIGCKTPTSTDYEYKQIGKFRVSDDFKAYFGESTFTAYDVMSRLTGKYSSSLTYPARLQAVVNEICQQATITAPTLVTNPWVNANVLEEFTHRDAIGYCAALAGQNAYINYQGNLTFKWYGETQCSYSVDNTRSNMPKAEKSNTVIKSLICNTGEETLQSGTGTAILFECPMMNSGQLGNLLVVRNNFTYRIAECSIPFGNYLIEPGDVITVQGLTIPVMSYKFKYDGGCSVEVSSYPVSDGTEASISARRFQNHVQKTQMHEEINHATAAISGAEGGFIKINMGDDGKPAELLIMDNADVSSAVNVWRFNQGGIAHSGNGYAGPYDVAITMDGHVVADKISGNKISGVGFESISDGEGIYSDSLLQITNGGIAFKTSDGDDLIGGIGIFRNQNADALGIASDDNKVFFGHLVNGVTHPEVLYDPGATAPLAVNGDILYKGADGNMYSMRNVIDNLISRVEALERRNS